MALRIKKRIGSARRFVALPPPKVIPSYWEIQRPGAPRRFETGLNPPRSCRQSPYVVMWLHYCSDSSLIALVSEYRPLGGWHVAGRYALRSRAIRLLQGRLSAGAPANPQAFEPVRADLFNILTEMNRREIQ